jgi:hypothetical protein
MQFMFSLIGEERSWEEVSPEEMKRNLAEMGEYNARLTEAGAMVFGAGLQERATGAVVHYGEGQPLVTDGPFAETKEQLAGFWIVEVEDREAAVEWARKIPLQSGHVEVRPVVADSEELLEKAGGS